MKFEVLDSNSATQPYFWRIIADNGKELARSETLTSKAYAISAAEKLKAYASNPAVYSFNVVASGSVAQPWRWHVTANNNEKVVAATENYHNWADAQSTADSVKYNAATATIVDSTRTAARR